MTKLTQWQFVQCYCHLDGLAGLSLPQWNSLYHVLKAKGLLASFYSRLNQAEQLDDVPEELLPPMQSAYRFAQAQQHQVQAKTAKLLTQLAQQDIFAVLLKGAAYIVGKTANYSGRLMSDIDIGVPHSLLSKTERVLRDSGWQAEALDDHDEKYYRQWAHELPPFSHPLDGVTLDVHHNLIPVVNERLVDMQALFAQSSEGIPANQWLVFHSALHLLVNEDIDNGLRDLTDMYLICREYDKAALDDQVALFQRQGFGPEIWLLAVLLRDFFAYTSLLQSVESRPSLWTKIRYALLKKILLPHSKFIVGTRYSMARFFYYCIGHGLKMPVVLLIKHFGYKLYRKGAKLIFGEFYFRD